MPAEPPKVLPAGSYFVEIDKISNALVCRNATEYATVNLAVGSAFRNESDAVNGKLTFNVYGTARVLSISQILQRQIRRNGDERLGAGFSRARDWLAGRTCIEPPGLVVARSSRISVNRRCRSSMDSIDC